MDAKAKVPSEILRACTYELQPRDYRQSGRHSPRCGACMAGGDHSSLRRRVAGRMLRGRQCTCWLLIENLPYRPAHDVIPGHQHSSKLCKTARRRKLRRSSFSTPHVNVLEHDTTELFNWPDQVASPGPCTPLESLTRAQCCHDVVPAAFWKMPRTWYK